MKYFMPMIVGFFVSKIFNKPMHSNGFPETGRYAFGYIVASFVNSYYQEIPLDKLIVGGVFFGAGVVLARLTE